MNEKTCKYRQNLPTTESIGNEEVSAKEGLHTLFAQGFEIRHITKDPDKSAHRAAVDLAEDFKTEYSQTI